MAWATRRSSGPRYAGMYCVGAMWVPVAARWIFGVAIAMTLLNGYEADEE